MAKTPKIDRQREHQANERTFLAWLRTSIALIGFGFAIARFGLFLRQLQASVTKPSIRADPFINSQSLGLGLVIIGIIVIGLSLWHYNKVFHQIESGDYRPSRFMVWITGGMVIILGLLSIPFLFWRQVAVPSQPSSGKSRVSDRQNVIYGKVAAFTKPAYKRSKNF